MGWLASLRFQLLFYCMVGIWSFMTLLRVLWEIIKHPIAVFKRTSRNVPPACLSDSSLGSHEYVTANGIKFHCVTSGDKSKPLMLFLHGFPEFWYSWRHQIREFHKDYRVVAIDMRGYGESDRPPKRLDYTFDILKQDIVELIAALGYSSCVLAAHDWGGIVAWRVVQRHPDLIDKFIVMNCPHPKVYKNQLAKGWSQLLKSWYIFMFQMPWLPEFVMRLGDYRQLNAMFRGRKAGVRNRAAFSLESLEAYKYTFSQPGALTGPFNYYRCMFQGGKETSKAPAKPIEVPVLIIWGDDDFFLDKDMPDNHTVVATNITVRHIPNCSHWVQQDAPDLCNQYMREFLETQ